MSLISKKKNRKKEWKKEGKKKKEKKHWQTYSFSRLLGDELVLIFVQCLHGRKLECVLYACVVVEACSFE